MNYPAHPDHHHTGQQPVHPNQQYGHPNPYYQAYPQHPPTPVNIVVQNTQHANPYAGGLVRIADRKKGPAVLLALFLGGFGIHRFYLGQTGMGVVYLLFSWTFIPAFVAFIEALLLLVMSQREFDMKYNVAIH